MAFYKHPLFLVAIGIVLVLAAVPSARTEVSSWFGSDSGSSLAVEPGDTVKTPVTSDGRTCSLSVATSTKVLVTEDYNPSTSVNDACQYKINGGAATSCTPGTAFTDAAPGDTLEVLVASNATSTTWYPVVYTLTGENPVVKDSSQIRKSGLDVPCAAVNNVNLVTGDIASMTTAIYNKDGTENINGTSGTQAVGTGASVTVDWNLVGSSEDWFGTKQAVLCAEFNNTAYNKVEISDNEGNVLPTFDKKIRRLTTAAGATENCYVDKAFRGAQDRVYKVRMEALSGTDPGSADDVSLTLLDDAYYLSSQDGNFKLGVETDADTAADVGAGDTTDTINVT